MPLAQWIRVKGVSFLTHIKISEVKKEPLVCKKILTVKLKSIVYWSTILEVSSTNSLQLAR